MEFLRLLFDSSFAARADGSCTGWSEELAAIDAVAHVFIGLTYIAISVVLWRSMLNTAIIPKPVARAAFLAFIFVCGVGHIISAVTNYWPVYRLMIVWDFFTAGVGLVGLFTIKSVMKQYRLKINLNDKEHKDFEEKQRQVQAGLINQIKSLKKKRSKGGSD